MSALGSMKPLLAQSSMAYRLEKFGLQAQNRNLSFLQLFKTSLELINKHFELH